MAGEEEATVKACCEILVTDETTRVSKPFQVSETGNSRVAGSARESGLPERDKHADGDDMRPHGDLTSRGAASGEARHPVANLRGAGGGGFRQPHIVNHAPWRLACRESGKVGQCGASRPARK